MDAREAARMVFGEGLYVYKHGFARRKVAGAEGGVRPWGPSRAASPPELAKPAIWGRPQARSGLRRPRAPASGGSPAENMSSRFGEAKRAADLGSLLRPGGPREVASLALVEGGL